MFVAWSQEALSKRVSPSAMLLLAGLPPDLLAQTRRYHHREQSHQGPVQGIVGSRGNFPTAPAVHPDPEETRNSGKSNGHGTAEDGGDRDIRATNRCGCRGGLFPTIDISNSGRMG